MNAPNKRRALEHYTALAAEAAGLTPVDVLAVPPHSSIEVTDWTCAQALAFAVNALREHHYRRDIVAKVQESAVAVAELIEREHRMRAALELLADGGRQPGHLTKSRVAEIARAALANVGSAS